MAKRNKELTQEHFINYWLEKGHGVTVDWLKKNEGELIKTSSWYKKYAVEKSLHDEWREWAIKEVMKYYKWNRNMAERQFTFAYLNLAPSVKE